jgi:hypothetical protein
VCAQPGFGVLVIWPQVGDDGFRSRGPNEPIPIASTGPSRSKKATTRPIVSSGIVVGIVPVARTSLGPVPTRAFPFRAASLDPAVDGHARRARSEAPHDLRTTNSAGRTTRRAQPSSEIACSTRRRVSGLTRWLPLITRETVIGRMSDDISSRALPR